MRGQQWCRSHHDVPYFETSAKEATNVERAFAAIARIALAREQTEGNLCEFPDPIRVQQDAAANGDKNNCACLTK